MFGKEFMRMRKGRSSIGRQVILPLLILLFSCAISIGYGETKDIAQLKIGVVDLDEVMSRSLEWQDFQKSHMKLKEKANKVLEKYKKQIKVLRNKYKNLPQGTDRADSKAKELRLTMTEYQRERKKYNQKLKNHRLDNLRKIFDKIQKIIAEYASKNDIALVLKKQRAGLSSMAPEEVGIVVATGDVLYAEDRLEITEVVIEKLNAGYPKETKEK